MGKVKDNAAVGTFGSIEATNAEIQQHKDSGNGDAIEGAIKDMVTGGQEKGKQSATHADNLRENYGDNLDKSFQDRTLAESIKGQIKGVDSQISELESSAHSVENANKFSALKEERAKLGSSLEQAEKGLTLRDSVGTIDQSKQESQHGQALGIKENQASEVSYAENAMYGEESQQQSTQAKILTQGGVDSAVNTDVADSSLKAAKQQDSLVAEMQQQIKADNPKVSDDDAKKIAEGFVKGGEEASKSITEAMNKGIDINAASAAVASAGALAGTMMGGKTAADIVSVDRADEKYKNGGYVGLQKDSAQIKTDSSIGDTSGLLDVPESHRESYIKGALQKADLTSAEKGKDVRDDFKRAGLINDDDSVNADNWVSGTGYLRANNMSSHNALVAGGMVFSGALGDDSTVKADGEESLKTGSSTTNNMDTAQKVSAFNAMQKATGGEEITYDENTGQLNIPDEKTGREFLSHVGKTDLVQKTGQNAVAETLGAVAETLGLSAETVVYGIGGAAVTGGAIGLGKKLSLGKKAKVHSTKDKRGDTDSDNIDTKHNPTPSEIKSQSETNLKAGRASYSEYSEERKNLQADANKESAKISDMQEKRVGLVADGKPTASIDHEISESQKRLDSTNGEIDSKTRQMDAQNTVNNLEKEKIAKIDESVKPLSLHLS